MLATCRQQQRSHWSGAAAWPAAWSGAG